MKYMNGLFVANTDSEYYMNKEIMKKKFFKLLVYITSLHYQTCLQCVSEIEYAKSRLVWKIFITNKCFSLFSKKYGIR